MRGDEQLHGGHGRPHVLLALAILALTITLAACGTSTGQATTKVSGSATASPSPLAAGTTAVPSGDWLRFDYDAQRSGVYPSSTGIDASDLGTLQRRVVHLSGVADSSAVELHAVRAAGRLRDLIFLTTTYGETIAIDPATGATVWRYVPQDIASYLGSRQITTATPIIDPNRAYLYAASPDGFIHKLAVASGAEVHSGGWPVCVTLDATHEKIAAALNISGDSLVVVTGGYIGDIPPYQGHVVMIDRASGRVTACLELARLEPPPSDSAELIPRQRLRDMGTIGGGDRARQRPHPGGDRQRSLQRRDQLGRQRARALAKRRPAAAQLDPPGSGAA